jgi:hypothetical protein
MIAGDVSVIVDVADCVTSVTDVAVMVTVFGLGVVAGAVYVIGAPLALDVAERDPHVDPLQPLPVSAQVTPLFALSFATVA